VLGLDRNREVAQSLAKLEGLDLLLKRHVGSSARLKPRY